MKPIKHSLVPFKEKSSAGTVMAESLRTRANALTESQRQANMVRAIQLVYGKTATPKRAHRR